MKTSLFSLVLFFASLTSYISAQTSLPNVVLVLADDVGPGDLSAYRRLLGQEVILETPNLDQLMANGTSFSDAHSPNALCAPSRYAIMTGNNTYHSYAPWGVWGAYQESPLKPTDMTLGKLMQQAGYQTAFLGKWHIGGDYYRKGTTEIYRQGDRSKPELDVDIRRIVGNGPTDHGFDYSLVFPAGIQDVPYAVYENDTWMPLYPGSEITEVTQSKLNRFGFKIDKMEGMGDSNWNAYDMGPLLVNKAVNYIREARTDQPLFMYYCSQAVHLPHTPAMLLDGQKVRGTTPSSHMDMVKELDVQVGMLVAALKEKGEYDNTLFIFTSDNGGLLRKESIDAGHNSPGIYRGGKNQSFEGGHRVPFIASWPGKIPTGTVAPELVSGTDIMATLAAITQQELAPHQAMDSYNFLRLMLGQPDAPSREYLMIQSGTDRKVIFRDGKWKLIMQSDKAGEKFTPVSLFDLQDNVAEVPAGDLIGQAKYSGRVKDMLGRYTAIRHGKLRTDGGRAGD
ncbi:arylsulfatase [Neolewinella aurantiaca]|uniref:Arylsulfatase n=1 Tax=Neolewinella aurantiaca TaxID=2602767 RepID=A0A5C7FK26_9BACT|nr:arylsulfatase [Neolewinella aurantiaca]TXF90221.1 arylsulfatase [Neolewinella aurantiaca]